LRDVPSAGLTRVKGRQEAIELFELVAADEAPQAADDPGESA